MVAMEEITAERMLALLDQHIKEMEERLSADKNPKIKAYLQRMAAHPKIAAYYAGK